MKDIFKILREAEKYSKEYSKDFEKELLKDPEDFVKKIISDNPEFVKLREHFEELSKDLEDKNKNKNLKQVNNLFDKLKKQENVSEAEKEIYHKLGERGINKELEQQEFCFVNDENCNHIIDSHSIQENGELSLIAKNKEVVAFQRKKGSNDKEVILVPISQASTFRGFCHHHDQIFEPLDKDKIESEGQRSFLYSFRTFAYSYFAKKSFNNFVVNGIENNLDMVNELIPSLEQISQLLGVDLSDALKQINVPEIADEQKQDLDEVHFESEKKQLIKSFNANDFDSLEHFVIELNHIAPLVYASILEFEFTSTGQIALNLNSSNSDNCFPIMCTIVPVNGRTNIILSGLKSDIRATHAVTWFKLVHTRNNLTIEHFISKLVLHTSKNLYLSPQYWNSLSSDFREKLISFVNSNEAGDLGRFSFFE